MVVFALLCSLLVALTLVPMLTSRFLTVHSGEKTTDNERTRLGRWFLHLENNYSSWL